MDSEARERAALVGKPRFELVDLALRYEAEIRVHSETVRVLRAQRDIARRLCRFAWQGRSVLPRGTCKTRQVIFLDADIDAMTERIKSWFGEGQWDDGLLGKEIQYPTQEAGDD